MDVRKNFFVCFFLFLLSLSSWAAIDVNGINSIYRNFLPKKDHLTLNANNIESGETVHHSYFSLNYVEEHELSNWVIYDLNRAKLIPRVKRRNNFREDPRISTYSASAEAYRGSGYDRGHMVPAGSMRFSRVAMDECFYMSNMSPQHPRLNQDSWRMLEQQIRQWAQDDHLVIISGPVLEPYLRKIKENVSVPKQFYKIVYKDGALIAFLFPNHVTNIDFMNYVTTVDVIESLTGLDFFSQLPDLLENQLESQITLGDWQRN